jgi:ankyrin repeat protein
MDRYNPGMRKVIGDALPAFSIAAFAQTPEERLFDAKADSRARKDDGESVLQWAVMAGNPAVAHKLLERFEKE